MTSCAGFTPTKAGRAAISRREASAFAALRSLIRTDVRDRVHLDQPVRVGELRDLNDGARRILTRRKELATDARGGRQVTHIREVDRQPDETIQAAACGAKNRVEVRVDLSGLGLRITGP